MGHFSMTCSISGLAITGGTPVRCLLLTASPYDEGDYRNAWVARTPPVRAVYNDYGSIEKVHKDDAFIANLWLRGLREDLVEKGLGDNSCHDSPTVKEMTFEDLLDALQERRVEVYQDAKHFWRRPLDGSWMGGLKEESLPFFKRIENLLAQVGPVSRNADTDTYVVDEPVPNLVRVRFGRYQHGADHTAALETAKAAVEKAGFVASVAAGSGRYPNDADLIVMFAPDKDKHFKGAQWDMAAHQKAAANKRLAVRLAMVREDVWQALIAYPQSKSVTLDCDNCGQQSFYHEKDLKCPNKSINNKPLKKHAKGSRYEHGPVFPKGVEHVVTQREYGETAWYGLAAFKASVRTAWESILEYFDEVKRIERLAQKTKSADPAIDKLFADFNMAIEAKRRAEQKRIAALPEEEQTRVRAEAKAQIERYEKQELDRKENPIFGDFLISDFAMGSVGYDNPGAWIFRHDVPGLIGIPEHLSMCLADKKTVPVHVLDVLAELAAFQHAMRDVGCVWRPVASTGPQDPDWKEHVRYQETLLGIAKKIDAKYDADGDEDLAGPIPKTLDEAIEKYGSPKSSKSKKI